MGTKLQKEGHSCTIFLINEAISPFGTLKRKEEKSIFTAPEI
jgi:hypothetical protein